MRAEPLIREKRILEHAVTGELAIAELKVWRVARSKDYPAGVKFSLFLVSGGEVLLGLDNHKPKGPHLHFGNKEVSYLFRNELDLLRDFWELARQAGFQHET